MPGGVISAGNASQFSGSAGACIVMNEGGAAQKGQSRSVASPRLRGGGCEPDGWASARYSPCPKVLKRLRLTVADIDLWGTQRGLRRAGAVLRRHAGHPDGPAQRHGAIAVGHPTA